MSTIGHVSDSGIQPVASADEGDWHAESASAKPPTAAELAERLKDAPTETPDPPPDATTQTDEAKAAQRARDEKTGQFTKDGRGEKRIETLVARIGAETKNLTTVRQQREAEEREVARLRAEKATLSGQAAPKATETPTDKTPEKPASKLGPKPTWKAYEAENKTWEQYEEDKDAWLVAKGKEDALAEIETRAKASDEQREKERKAALGHRRTQEFNSGLTAFRAAHADYDEAVKTLVDAGYETPPFVEDLLELHPKRFEIVYHLGKHPELAEALESAGETFSMPMFDFLMESDDPVQLFAALASDPVERERIAHLSSRTKQLVALGSLQQRILGANDGSPKPAPVSNAKPPIQPVGGNRSTAGERPDPDDIEDWIASENKKERERLRRPA